MITTLAVAALFLPARRCVQDGGDRRFNRRAYDAAGTIDVFSARPGEQADLDRLHDELLTVTGSTLRPKAVSLRLRGRVPGNGVR